MGNWKWRYFDRPQFMVPGKFTTSKLARTKSSKSGRNVSWKEITRKLISRLMLGASRWKLHPKNALIISWGRLTIARKIDKNLFSGSSFWIAFFLSALLPLEFTKNRWQDLYCKTVSVMFSLISLFKKSHTTVLIVRPAEISFYDSLFRSSARWSKLNLNVIPCITILMNFN